MNKKLFVAPPETVARSEGVETMRILVACEYSGRVREAFRARGHDAWSCDLEEPEDGSAFHYQCSVISHDIIKLGWDMLIAFPDCTYRD